MAVKPYLKLQIAESDLRLFQLEDFSMLRQHFW